MFQWLKNRYRRYRYRKTLKQVREQFSFFGCDLSYLSDEQIEQGVREAGNLFAKAGITVNEANIAVEEFRKKFVEIDTGVLETVSCNLSVDFGDD